MKGYAMLEIDKPGWVEKPKPVAGPLDAIVKTVAAAVCTSDTHTLHGGAGDLRNRILGHEAVGIVEEVGSLVTRIKPGDLVAVNCVTPDWNALSVQERDENCSHDHGPLKSFKFLFQKDGVFAEYFHVNNADANLAIIPEGVSIEDALMTTDMMSTAFYGVENAEVKFGDTVVVYGIGPVGLMAIAGAALSGAARIIGIGTRPNCAALAREYGATDIVSYKDGDLVEQITTLCGGKVDKVILAGGDSHSIVEAFRMTKPNGIISNIRFVDPSETISFSADDWTLGMGDVTLRAGFCPGGARRIERLLALIKCGRVKPGKMLNKRFEGLEGFEAAVKIMDEKPRDLIKPYVYIGM